MTSASKHQPTLSLCMIVKNEQQHLERCLKSASPYVDEIVVIDTGSDDSTLNIAAQYGAKIGHFAWCDDFAAARNYAISQATGEWILMLDADEELIVEDPNWLKQLKTDSNPLVYGCSLEDAYKRSQVSMIWASRLFQNKSEIKYEGQYHEKLCYQDQLITMSSLEHVGCIKILHYGYGEVELAQKHHSRTQMLEQLLQVHGLDLSWLWTLAVKYARNGELDKAEQCYSKAWEYLLPDLLDGQKPKNLSYVSTWMYALGMRALQAEDLETALLICQQGLTWSPHYPPLSYLAGLLTQALGLPLGATAYYSKCLQFGQKGNYLAGEPFERKLITSYPAHDLGLAYMELHQWEKAKEAFELALSFDSGYEPAQKSLEEVSKKFDLVI